MREKLLSLARQLSDLAPRVLDRAQKRMPSELKEVSLRPMVYIFLLEALEYLQAAVLLFESKSGQATYPLVRAVLERAVEIAYIRKLSEEPGFNAMETATRLVYDAECRRIWLKSMYGAGLTSSERKRQAEHCKGRAHKPATSKGWQPGGVEAHMKYALDPNSLYDAYRHLSTLTHPNVIFSAKYFEMTGGAMRFRGSDPELDVDALMILVGFGIMAIERAGRILRLGTIAGFQRVVDSYTAIQS